MTNPADPNQPPQYPTGPQQWFDATAPPISPSAPTYGGVPLNPGVPMNYYPNPEPQYGPPLTRPTSGLATASMVLGIIGLLVGWCTFGLPSFIAVFLGHAALKETRTGVRGGHGMAIAGLILGYIVAVPAAVVTVIFIIGAAGGN